VLQHAIGLTESQQEVWLATQTQPEASLAYNEGIALSLTGPLDPDALRASVEDLVRRHDCLRGTVSADGQWLYVRQFMRLDIPISAMDLRAAEAIEMGTGFDLDQGPLVRFRIVRESDALHHLLIVAHHIILDDWSASVLVQELATIYAARVGGHETDLPPAPTFADYVSAEREFMSSAEGQAHTAYWLRQLQATPQPIQLPMDLPRPARRTYGAESVQYPIDATLVGRLARLGADHGVGSTAIALAAFAALLHRVTGSADLIIGLTVPGQPFYRQPRLIGHCINFLPLRVFPSPDLSFGQFLKTVDCALSEALSHQGVTLGSLLSQVKVQRDPQRSPLVSVTFNIEERDLGPTFVGVEASYRRLPRTCETFDLRFNLVTRQSDLLIECSYNTDLFSRALIEARLEEFEALLRSVSADSDRPLDRLNVLSDRCRRQILDRWNDTARAYPSESTLQELLAAGARRWPDRSAVVTETGTLSYREVDERAEVVASHLRKRGVGPDVLVGVCAYRSVEMVIALLGILKAGGAYVPIDPDDPADRLTFMVEDADCRIILAGPDLGAATSKWLSGLGCDVLAVDSMTQPAAGVPGGPAATADALAYVIFTSGSTGRPKGTMLTHRGVVNRLLWGQEHYPIGPGDRLLQKTPYTFDVSVPEFFWPLITGATLVMARPGGHRDPDYLVELIQREEITVCHFVPSMMGPFLDHSGASDCGTLRHVFASGEALPYSLERRFYNRLPRARLHNLYGPTEASVEVSYWDCPVTGDPRGLVPIGRPVANTQLYVLDRWGEPVPPAVPGELYLGGVQLARGYLNRPALTAEQFVTHPQFGRLYRTGDVARWLPEGVVDFLGRADRQVKLRGFRIELGEIEEQLLALPQVSEALVAVRERVPGDPWLVAWLRPRPGEKILSSEISRSLASRLPAYMIPQVFMSVAEFPRLTSGKIDRNRLPHPFGDLPTDRPERQPPASPRETHLAGLWQQLLGVASVGRNDRFVDLGGHSLLAVQLVTSLEQHYGVRLPLRAIMMESLAVLAQQLPGSDRAETACLAPRAEARGLQRDAFFFGDRTRHLFGALTVPAVQARQTGIVICPSWGTEYMRAYRGLNRFGERLVGDDFAVLRFDYASTGDSAGDASEARVEEWLENIAMAAVELRRRAPVDHICLVGLRLGALLAQRAVRDGVKASHLVLWDPPANGSSWLETLRGFENDYHEITNNQRARGLKLQPPPVTQLLGLPLPDELKTAIESLTLTSAPADVEQIVVSTDSSLRGLDRDAVRLPDPDEWSLLSRMTTPWNPVPSISVVANMLRERLP
jgi:amino acid adenylation domain-containing protein